LKLASFALVAVIGLYGCGGSEDSVDSGEADEGPECQGADGAFPLDEECMKLLCLNTIEYYGTTCWDGSTKHHDNQELCNQYEEGGYDCSWNNFFGTCRSDNDKCTSEKKAECVKIVVDKRVNEDGTQEASSTEGNVQVVAMGGDYRCAECDATLVSNCCTPAGGECQFGATLAPTPPPTMPCRKDECDITGYWANDYVSMKAVANENNPCAGDFEGYAYTVNLTESGAYEIYLDHPDPAMSHLSLSESEVPGVRQVYWHGHGLSFTESCTSSIALCAPCDA
jgi:hypothetical protein